MKTHVVREHVYDNGGIVFSGTEEECNAYVRDRDKGYAGVRPCFSVQAWDAAMKGDEGDEGDERS